MQVLLLPCPLRACFPFVFLRRDRIYPETRVQLCNLVGTVTYGTGCGTSPGMGALCGKHPHIGGVWPVLVLVLACEPLFGHGSRMPPSLDAALCWPVCPPGRGPALLL